MTFPQIIEVRGMLRTQEAIRRFCNAESCDEFEMVRSDGKPMSNDDAELLSWCYLDPSMGPQGTDIVPLEPQYLVPKLAHGPVQVVSFIEVL